MVWVMGCAGGPMAPDDAKAPAVEVAVTGPPSLELGGGTTRHIPLPQGGSIELVLGPQGGWHLDLTVRAVNLPPDGVTLSYEVRDDTRPTPWNFPVMARLNARRVVADGVGWVRVGDRAVLDIRSAQEVTGRMVRIDVWATQGGRTVAEDNRRVRVVDKIP